RLTKVWVASAETAPPPVRVFAVPSANARSISGSGISSDVEEVHDLSWAPDGQLICSSWCTKNLLDGRDASDTIAPPRRAIPWHQKKRFSPRLPPTSRPLAAWMPTPLPKRLPRTG